MRRFYLTNINVRTKNVMNLNTTLKSLGWLVLAIMLPVLAFGQGVTTSSLNGRVVDSDGEPLTGATVVAVHTPTGSTYGNTTNEKGFYRIPNMRIGGPYKVKITYVGYQPFESSDIYLTLGQAFELDVEMSGEGVSLAEVEITSSRSDVFDGNRTGTETVISEQQINSLPTVSRSIGDFARLNPQTTAREGSDGYSLSIGGQNNRYNAIYIDGAVNNDVFGLAGSGTNGGQTGVSPIPLDAIEEFQIQLAPFDVRIGGFAGGAINAVTRSGSNNLEASAYGFFRNQALAGRTPTDDPDRDREQLPDFSAYTAGFRVGGALVEDKVFYFINAEQERLETPQPFNFADYDGDATEAQLNELVSLVNELGYDPGTFTNNQSFLNSEKVNVRFDFNLSQDHKLAIRHGYVNARNLEGVRSSSQRIRFLNESEYFNSVTNSTAIELSSVFGNNFSNNLKIGLTFVRDDRDPYQGEGAQADESEDPNYFPYLSIRDGAGRITLGSEQFSTANALNQNVITLTDNFEIYTGRHTITFGTHNEFYDVYNLFIRQNYGVYEYNGGEDVIIEGNDTTIVPFTGLEQLLRGDNASEFFRSYSLRDNVTGDGSVAASEFTGAQFGFYVQDEWQTTDRLKLTYGLRLDIPVYFTDIPVNEDFNNNTIPQIEAEGYDLRGARTGAFIDPQLLLSPRLGFNWDVTGNKTAQVRGGFGIFTSRIPLVWPGGAFNNNGVTVGGDFNGNPDFGVTDFPEWDDQPQNVQPGEGEPSGQVDLFASDFKVPRILKANIAYDQKLGNGFVFNAEFLFNKTLQNVAYQNVNLKQADAATTGTGEVRPIFDRRDEIDPTYTRILLATNTPLGYTWNLSTSISKAFTRGLSGTVAYSYGDAYSVFDGTSSQNSSQWRGLHAVQGRNFDWRAQRSDFSPGHRVIAGLTYQFDWNKARNATTTISVFYEGISGEPYTFVVGDGEDIQEEDSRNRTLFYVPMSEDDINFTGSAEDQSAQWNALNNFIEDHDYLSRHRGEFVERNHSRAPFTSVLDLRIMQDVRFYAGGKTHTLQLTADIFNFTNLINAAWGRRYFVPSNFNLTQFEGFQVDGNGNETTIPTYRFTAPEDFPFGDIDDSGIQSSRWQAQLGVRYLFN